MKRLLRATAICLSEKYQYRRRIIRSWIDLMETRREAVNARDQAIRENWQERDPDRFREAMSRVVVPYQIAEQRMTTERLISQAKRYGIEIPFLELETFVRPGTEGYIERMHKLDAIAAKIRQAKRELRESQMKIMAPVLAFVGSILGALLGSILRK